MKIVKVIVNDHSHLGGPMGTKYTTTIFTKVFKTWDGAFKYAKQFIKENYKHLWKDQIEMGWNKKPFDKISKKGKQERLADIGPIGFDFEEETLGE